MLDVINFINWCGIPLIFIAVVLIINLFIVEKKSRFKNNPKELKEADSGKEHGIVFGKRGRKLIYSPENSEGHIGVFSASGTGKTSAIGIPSLRGWRGTSYTIDISGDICKNCSEMPNKLIFAPEDYETAPYNIFGVIDDLEDMEDKNEALEQLAFLLMPEVPNMNENAKFFLVNGRKILTASLIAFYGEGMDFIEIAEKIVGNSWHELFKIIDQTENKQAIMYINGFEGASDQNNAGCKQSCDDALKLFATNVKVKRSIRRPIKGENAVEPKRIEQNNIFVIVGEDKLALYAPLMNILSSQIIQYIGTRQINQNSPTILLFLDEFGSLKLDAELVLDGVRRFRKRKCRIMVLMQNIVDMDLLYGHDAAKAILSNLRFKILLGGLGEPDSQTYFSNLIGFKDSKKKSTSRNAKSITTTISTEKEYIISPADLDRQGRDTVILICPDAPGYFLLKKNYYFK